MCKITFLEGLCMETVAWCFTGILPVVLNIYLNQLYLEPLWTCEHVHITVMSK